MASVGILLLCTLAVLVCGEVQFLQKHKGESVVLSCEHPTGTPPDANFNGLYLKRKWLQQTDVLFLLTKEQPHIFSGSNKERISVIGDPATRQVNVNVTITQLKGSDTDCYYCVFVIQGIIDTKVPSHKEFCLHVFDVDVTGSPDIGLIETSEGGSAVLPCLGLQGEVGAMEGLSLKRRRGSGPVEVLYHSKRPLQYTTSPFPVGRFHLDTAPSGLAYNLTLLRLRPEDSALYCCELLLSGRPDHSATLGKHVYFVSVQGAAQECDCPSYVLLLYITSGAVGLLLLFIVGLVVAYRGKTRHSVKPLPHQPPIYEEMVGVRQTNSKITPFQLEGTDTSLYSNTKKKENYYECSKVPDNSSEYQP